jgi:hypothetical protein
MGIRAGDEPDPDSITVDSPDGLAFSVISPFLDEMLGAVKRQQARSLSS